MNDEPWNTKKKEKRQKYRNEYKKVLIHIISKELIDIKLEDYDNDHICGYCKIKNVKYEKCKCRDIKRRCKKNTKC